MLCTEPSQKQSNLRLICSVKTDLVQLFVMNTWLQVIFFSFIGSVASLAGGIYMLYGRARVARVLQKVAVPFAAGALLAAAFFDLLPEALEQAESHAVLTWTLVGFLGFFVAERGLHWFHHHHEEDAPRTSNRALIVIGDTLHNFMDGLAIGATFLVSPASGIITTLAVSAHEVPREIGDFGLLLSKGMTRKRVFMVSFFAALAGVAGAVLMFGFGEVVHLPTAILLSLTAGFFIYIAASDIIPSIHQKEDRALANTETAVLIGGTILVALLITVIHQFVAV